MPISKPLKQQMIQMSFAEPERIIQAINLVDFKNVFLISPTAVYQNNSKIAWCLTLHNTNYHTNTVLLNFHTFQNNQSASIYNAIWVHM